MKNQHYTVTKDSKPQFRGSDFECFEYILKHQPNSVDHATKYEGWAIEKTTFESLIIEACHLQEGFKLGRFYSKQAQEHATERFEKEMDWAIERRGLFTACVEWFQGLALAVPYMNYEIEQLGFDSETYWEDIAKAFLGMTETNAPDQELCEAIEAL